VSYYTILAAAAQDKCGAVSTIAERSFSSYNPPRARFLHQFQEPVDGFVSAQQVRDIRAQLRTMSEANASAEGAKASRDSVTSELVGTEHRGVPGTLILTDVLDEKVRVCGRRVNGSMLICRIWSVSRVHNFIPLKRRRMERRFSFLSRLRARRIR
jgi:hypothetical protein